MSLQTSRGLRPHLAICGPCNSGKSSLLNSLAGAQVAMVSATEGTTSDPVYRNLELLPYGPVTLVDTAGMDDRGSLGPARLKRTLEVLGEADVLLVTGHPANLLAVLDMVELLPAAPSDTLRLLVLTHDDQHSNLELTSDPVFQEILKRLFPGITPAWAGEIFKVSNHNSAGIQELGDRLCAWLETHKSRQKPLLADLLKPCRLVMMVVPVDLEAPAGRLILPQVQAIRETLDSDAATLVVKDREIDWALSLLKTPPDLVICDSQVVLKTASAVPETVPLSTFSILFSRQKGDLATFVRGARVIDQLKDGDRVLVAETCLHRSSCDDIGVVKIPRWLRQYTGARLVIEHSTGRLPDNLLEYRLLIHCGGCMISPRMMKSRMETSQDQGLAITNYGLAISFVQGVLDRVIKPFGLDPET